MDKFNQNLEDKLKELTECKESRDLKTCSKCDEFYSCIIRLDYVKSVYQSMAKDGIGNFNF